MLVLNCFWNYECRISDYSMQDLEYTSPPWYLFRRLHRRPHRRNAHRQSPMS